jgi:hypothetical protein
MTGCAKQSIEPQGRMDCFVASLLAMTIEKQPPALLPTAISVFNLQT